VDLRSKKLLPTKQIKTIDIIGGTPEQIGKYRIVWNKRWLDKKTNICANFERHHFR